MSAEQRTFGRIILLAIVVAFSFGAGVTLTVVYFWNRAATPSAWNTVSVTATFAGANEWDNVDASGKPLNSGHFELRYVLENHTESDYRVADIGGLSILMKHGSGYEPVPDASLRLPIFVPAKHRVFVGLNLPFDVFDQIATSTPTDQPIVSGLSPTSSQLFHQKFRDISEFAVFDDRVRYRIDLQKP